MSKTAIRDFSKLLRRLRLEAGLSQESLAEQAGISVVAISRYERDVRWAPRRDTIALLVSALRLQGDARDEFEAAAERKRVGSSQEKARHNLPWQHTSFVGRDRDIQEISELLGPRRVVTIVGSGGIGKTRCALEVAWRLAHPPRHGMMFVDLAPLTDGALVLPQVASVLDVNLPEQDDLQAALVTAVGERELLLVLDNCEHVIADVSAVAGALMNACPHIALLATSRERLGIAGETAYQLQPLAFQTEALELFAQRAEASVSGFSLSNSDEAAATEICRRLDGVPLAIELAAARITMMTVHELSRRLDDRFRVLSGGTRATVERHRTLHALIAWSYDLLDEREKALLRRLAIFAGEFSLDAAIAVCAFGSISESEVLDLTGALIDKSLVQSEPSDDEQRHRLLESTKAFCLDRLDEMGEREAARARHLQYFTLRAKAGVTHSGTAHYEVIRSQIAAELAEYRAALHWALLDRGDSVLGVKLAVDLATYWSERGLSREGRFWLERAVDLGEATVPLELQAKALRPLSALYNNLGEYALMGESARRAADICAKIGDDDGLAKAQNLLGVAAYRAGNFEQAYELLQSFLANTLKTGNRRQEVTVRGNLGLVLTDWKADYEAAEMHYARAIAICRASGTVRALGNTLGNLSETVALRGDIERAASLARESLETLRQASDESLVIEALIRIGSYCTQMGAYDEVSGPLREAIEALRLSKNTLFVARCVETCADFALSKGDVLIAIALLSFSSEWRAMKNLPRAEHAQTRYETTLSSARAAFGSNEFANAVRTGAVFTLEEALDLAESIVDGNRSALAESASPTESPNFAELTR